jgi:hypothetical protein
MLDNHQLGQQGAQRHGSMLPRDPEKHPGSRRSGTGRGEVRMRTLGHTRAPGILRCRAFDLGRRAGRRTPPPIGHGFSLALATLHARRTNSARRRSRGTNLSTATRDQALRGSGIEAPRLVSTRTRLLAIEGGSTGRRVVLMCAAVLLPVVIAGCGGPGSSARHGSSTGPATPSFAAYLTSGSGGVVIPIDLVHGVAGNAILVNEAADIAITHDGRWGYVTTGPLAKRAT